MRLSLEVVTGEARKVEAKNLRTYTWTVSIRKTGWKLILSQNIGKLLNVVVEAKPGTIDFKCPVHQRLY